MPAAPTPAGGELRVGLRTLPASPDPWETTDGDALAVLRQVFEPLLEQTSAAALPAPRLAVSWEPAEGGSVWMLRLREDVRFHDGSRFDAASVAANFERGRTTAAYRAAFGAGEADAIAGIDAPDPSTVVFRLRRAIAAFPALLARPSFGMISPATLAAGAAWAAPRGGPAGTGPFRFGEAGWVPGADLVLERAGEHWERAGADALPYLDRVRFRAVPDAPAALRSGQVDLVLDLPRRDAESLRADPKLAVTPRPATDLLLLRFALTTPPFDRAEVRRAVALAIDRRSLALAVYGSDEPVASGLLPAGALGFDDSVTEFSPHDAAAAERLLAEAGIARLPTDLWYPAPTLAHPDTRRVAEAIAADLARVGIVAAPRLGKGGTGLALVALPPWTGDPDGVLGWLFGRGAGDASWPNEQARLLVALAGTEPDPTKRSELYKQVGKLAVREIPVVPLVHASSPIVHSRRVVGLVPGALGGESLARVRLVP